jgi:hypothetical protein
VAGSLSGEAGEELRGIINAAGREFKGRVPTFSRVVQSEFNRNCGTTNTTECDIAPESQKVYVGNAAGE